MTTPATTRPTVPPETYAVTSAIYDQNHPNGFEIPHQVSDKHVQQLRDIVAKHALPAEVTASKLSATGSSQPQHQIAA